MTALRYILASLRHYRRIHAAVACGVAVAAAVITGALLVGDSVRGSLRELALEGLGRIDSVLVAEQPFREDLAREWGASAATKEAGFADAVPLMLVPGSLTTSGGTDVRRATRLQVTGAPAEFWKLTADGKPLAGAEKLAGNQALVTAGVAAELGVKAGDDVLLRVARGGSVPADSTLGEKEDTTAARRLKVAGVLPDDDGASLARFGLRPMQQAPRNVFVPLATLQSLLEKPERALAIALARAPGASQRPATETERSAAFEALMPTLDDFGVKVEEVALDSDPPRDYVRVSAERLVLPASVVEAVGGGDGGNAKPQAAATYLANSIRFGQKRIPYSTVVGVDSTSALGPVLDDAGKPVTLADDEVVLNDWAADDLGAKVGDEVTLAYYEPETTDGELREHGPPLVLKVRAIAPLADADGKPTPAADPNFAPDLPGVTDEASIADWDLPFELVEKVRDKDEEYWDKYRTTPKAFVSHALAAKLWGTRWGTESVLRVPGPATGDGNAALASVATNLAERLTPGDMGMTLRPVREQVIAASTGTTPFDGLFLGFSFFLLASAMILTALLFRLGVESRARETGLLAAAGLSRTRIRRLMLGEGAVVAAIGAAAGAALGVAYARLLVHGLNTWWVAATAAPFLRLHVTPRSIVIGLAAGLIAALAAIAWSLRGLLKLPPRQLLAGDAQPPLDVRGARRWSATFLPAGCLATAVGLGLAAAKLEGEARAGAFFGAGALAMIGMLAAVRARLRAPGTATPRSLTLGGLAVRNARRNPGRTMMALGLGAAASFLIVALSAFRLAPTERGVGGFDLIATADLPIHYGLGTAEGRKQLGFSAEDDKALVDATVVGFRVRDGEDASCLNLYQTAQPRILGAPASLEERSEFAWAGEEGWSVLSANLGKDDAGRAIVPMVVDRNTAFYSLKLDKVGDRLTVEDAAGRDVTLQIVGLLANSVLQGDVIISEENFLRLFPEVGGERFFLIRGGKEAPPTAKLASLLETQLEDFGFDAVDARARLADLMAVQNTYLSTFQSLGALGLLLGAAGLAIVQLRNVLERRGELALMQAAGFRRRRLMWMVLAENLVLLVGGLAIGCVAAIAAVLPNSLAEQVTVPWRTLSILLAIVVAVGVVAAWRASRSVLKAPLLPALRGD